MNNRENIECTNCNNYFLSIGEKDRICKRCFDRFFRKWEMTMSKEAWKKFEDTMPILNKEIEVEHRIRGKIKIAISIYNSDLLKIYENGDIYFIEIDDAKAIFKKWREIPERKPDFSKLKEGDHIIATNNCGEKYSGFIYAMDNFNLHISMCEDGYSRGIINIGTIKKIIRIKLEEKEFEEI